jgi:hypothetical protein
LSQSLATTRRLALRLADRLDTLAAAALLTFGLQVVPQRLLCEEVTCASLRDKVLCAAFVVLAGLALTVALWRTTRRWWARVGVVVAALYVSNQLPVWLGRNGRWRLVRDDGRTCTVNFHMPRDAVRGLCGAPTHSCEGPKYIEPQGLWNPVTATVCGFWADVFRDRLVTYGCSGGVAAVAAIPPEPPEKRRPVGCVQWTRPMGADIAGSATLSR